ncbi:MAG TPA: LuxR C-terminal-related transcriptional regulator [Nocardioides sp.]|nr:LuxR C-terminal-related transcriptional regulator [Nocardioides sp.]
MGGSELERGRAAYDERRWDVCVEHLLAADAHHPLDGDDLKLLGLSLYMTGADEASVEVLERAHRLALAQERWPEAAETAFWYAFMLVNTGEPARGGAWLARSRAIIEEHAVSGPMAAFPDVIEARGLVQAGRVDDGMALATSAARVGQLHGNANLEVLGRLVIGWALLRQGRSEEALRSFDEVMLTVSASDPYPTVAGLAYCAVISACMSQLDVPRAQEWTGVLSDWCDSQSGLVPYRGQCLVHRSQLRAMRGDWVGALDEARAACERLGGTAIGDAWYQLGELHRLRGEYAEAESAYRHANSQGRQPEPGLAMMRLTQGRVDTAVTTFRRLYAEPGRIDRADVLAGYVEAMVTAGDLDAAQVAVDELTTANQHGSPVHEARAAEACASVLFARGDAPGALAHLRPALEVWHSLEMPYDGARVRVRIGDACRSLGDEASAALEYDAARETFARVGAIPDLQRLDGAARAGQLTAREVEVLRLVAAGHTNRVIARELVLSEKTVARHLSNIYAKLGIGSRAAATAYAYDHQLV